MASVSFAVRVGLASTLLSSCFSSQALIGSPCVSEDACGDDLECIDNFCKPGDCVDNPDCQPYEKSCVGGAAASICTDVGASGCFYATKELTAGYCALTCDTKDQCPQSAEGMGTPDCIDSPATGGGAATVCALDCSEGLMCPSYMHCAEVTIGGTLRSLCLSGAAPAPMGDG